ncbi:MAG: DNA polymerase IV [Pseudomonadota bacterium]
MTKKIIHIDMDCFYAAIEIRDNPELKNKPVAVGGSPDERGVLATANYVARKFGVHSALSSRSAVQRCSKLIIIPPDFKKYKEESRIIMDIFHDYTDLIEPLSLDEAFLDVTFSEKHKNSATLIAKEILNRIKTERNLTASAGVAPNKLLAKIASDINKPNGIFIITPKDIDSFVFKLPVKRLFGVGKVTESKMKALGVNSCSDLQFLTKTKLQKEFGKFGNQLFNMCRGIDTRDVDTSRVRKSLSVERTFNEDLVNLFELKKNLPSIFDEFSRRFLKIKRTARIKACFVKIKFNDFTQTTVDSCELKEPSLSSFKALLERGFLRKEIPVRLIGLGVRLDSDKNEEERPYQMGLF